MVSFIRLLAFVFCLTFLLQESKAKDYVLFREGQSRYSIVIPFTPTESEKYAASELQNWLSKISNVKIPIIKEGKSRKGRRILIGNCKEYKKLVTKKEKSFTADSFVYQNVDGDIFINGGQRGVIYGVYSFLKNEFDCRWYTKDEFLVPRKRFYKFSMLHNEGAPAFDFRQVFFFEARDYSWKVRNGINVVNAYIPTIPEKTKGGCFLFSGMHTFNKLVPVDKYYSTHPEYFSEVNGKRLSFQTQLCLSNPSVLKLCVKGILKQIEDYPDCDTYSLSQNDWLNPCECKECKKLIKRYGSQSGVLIWFVNQVADRVKKRYPNKYISTLAYQYTMPAPKNIKPRDNVIIYLCDIEDCTLHDWDNCKENAAFYKALREWSSLTKNIYVNDYVSNFMEYPLPVPNFHLFQSKIKKCKELGCRGFRAYGSNMTPNGAFSALKNYVLAQLLWNPYQNVDNLVNDFLRHYYESSAKYVREYYDLLQSKVGPDVHMHNFDSYKHKMYDDAFIKKVNTILTKAAKTANSEVVHNRVEDLQITPAYINCRRHPKEAMRNGSYELVKRVMKRDGMTLLGERVTIGQFEKVMNVK